MTPTEKLEAAIAKLEEVSKELSVINGWLVTDTGRHNCAGGTVESGGAHEPHCGFEPITNDVYSVTLHRTIDAQLELLRSGLRAHRHIVLGALVEAERRILGLAESILNEES